ncbi:hypothetical protein [Gracilibacillus suaedae]|uniref:hypothetical protein n=1 Tax=Gracilibacillus suaedae TaxID=2820273 RepID=UPI001ABDB8F2|nr:hypothetical protein [Gracilibacillus suaedae]
MDETQKLYCMIYELKGIVNSLSDAASYDEQFDNPLLENVQCQVNEIVNHIEKPSKSVLLEGS